MGIDIKIAKERKSVKPSQLEKVGRPDWIPEDHFVVLIDSAEGHRIPVPPTIRWSPKDSRSILLSVGSRVVNLGRVEESRGDITMEGYTHVVGIERKGKVSELDHNIKTGKLKRQLSTLASLVKHPYLLLDIPLMEMYGTGRNAMYREGDITPTVLDKVIRLANRCGVKIIGPVTAKGTRTRKMLGEYLVRVMLSHIEGETYVPYRALQKRERRKRT